MKRIVKFFGVGSFGKEQLPSRRLMDAKKLATRRGCDRLIVEETFVKRGVKGNLFPIGSVYTNYYRGKRKWENDENETLCNLSFQDLISLTKQLA